MGFPVPPGDAVGLLCRQTGVAYSTKGNVTRDGDMSRKNDSPGVILSQLPESLRPSIERILEHVLHGAYVFVDLSTINACLDADIACVIRGLQPAGLSVVRHYLQYEDESPRLVGLHIVLK